MANNGSYMINIFIKMVDSRTFCLRVHNQIPVPLLRGHIAMVTGIPVQNQRIRYAGRVLTDENALSSYNVQDGNTLHLVAGQTGPVRFQGQSSSSFAMSDPAPDSDADLMNRIIMSLASLAVSSNPNSPAWTLELGRITSTLQIDPTNTPDEAANGGRSRRRGRDPWPSSSDRNKHQKRAREGN